MLIRVSGPSVHSLFSGEAGGHRWQRIPPTERQGRVHSSTITVAVFSGAGPTVEAFRESDVSIETTRGHGPGGQNRNKVETAVRAIHRPTGEMVFIQHERSQKDNKRLALEELRRRVEAAAIWGAAREANADRRQQIGRGERSDKIRTVQCQNDQVTNHRNGKRMNLSGYLKGDIWRIQ